MTLDIHGPRAPPPYISSACVTSSPPYSPTVGELEEVLQSEPLVIDNTGHSAGLLYLYRSEHLEVNLGSMLWGTTVPSYGRNGIIHGSVRLLGSLKHTVKITASLKGKIAITATERGLVTGASTMRTVNNVTTLFPSENTQGEGPFQFSLPFPTYCAGRGNSLPSTYAVYHIGVTYECTYEIRVDLTRKGLRRHETVRVPLLYLPRTYAHASVPAALPISLGEPSHPPSFDAASDRHKVTELKTTWPQAGLLSSSDTVPRVFLTLPVPLSFPAFAAIPLSLSLSCLNAPAVIRLLSAAIRILLIRRTMLGLKEGRSISKRETILGTADIVRVDESKEGVSIVNCQLRCGSSNAEFSWAVDGMVSQQYVIRVLLRPPKSMHRLPSFEHDELIEIATDPWDSAERDSVAAGATPVPAFGLLSRIQSNRSAFAQHVRLREDLP